MLYLTEGDYINAGLSALSIIPGADAFTKTGKASKVLGNGIVESGLKHLDNVADGIKKLVKKADYDYLRMTGELPATNETFISPTYSFSSDYDGITVEFELKKETTNSLLEIGVGNNAFFKGEGTQTNIGLGKGKALEIFNSNIINFRRTGGK